MVRRVRESASEKRQRESNAPTLPAKSKILRQQVLDVSMVALVGLSRPIRKLADN
jgi:hypothetical protein